MFTDEEDEGCHQIKAFQGQPDFFLHFHFLFFYLELIETDRIKRWAQVGPSQNRMFNANELRVRRKSKKVI